MTRPSADDVDICEGLGDIDIKCNGKTEHFEVAFFCRLSTVVRRLLWKAYRKDESDRTRRYYAIKDSWRPVIREAEGEMLQRVTSKLLSQHRSPSGIAAHYHHEDLEINRTCDDILASIDDIAPTQPKELVDGIYSRTILRPMANPLVNSPTIESAARRNRRTPAALR
ncbi:hypothetical protein BC938DRAFT_482727 [Jimgerdemannia flammicorona]|uniref:Fungal-type protein kinase domain-containing protein n=1 Tax=Jimgerdemannia flammicorona TaxID=994334 RepID=A0A433QDE9_9FUNG|nr:hypothetical protein BC938DRAFT_482727 [Jimgerdemannia flammicorona]